MRTSDPSCTNCQGWGCMDCVLRYWHDDCEHTCPMCEPLAEVGLTEKTSAARRDEEKR